MQFILSSLLWTYITGKLFWCRRTSLKILIFFSFIFCLTFIWIDFVPIFTLPIDVQPLSMVMLAVLPEEFKLEHLLTKKYCTWILWWRRICANLNKYPFLLCRNFQNCMRCKFGNVTHLPTSTCCVFNIQVMTCSKPHRITEYSSFWISSEHTST